MKQKNKTKRKYILAENFKESWKYVGENKKYIFSVFAIFIIFIIIALVFPVPAELEQQIKLMIRKLVLATKDLNWLDLISYIFTNNLVVSITAVIFGSLFCLAPLIITVFNGYVLGYVVKITIQELGFSGGIASLWRLLPHGIFEIPAIIISLALGFKLGVSFFNSLNKNSLRFFLNDFWKAVRAIFYVILPLLIIAAIIEGILIKIIA